MSNRKADTLRRSDGSSLITEVQHDGPVWCPTTGTGTWIARREGHVFITGNSHYGACCRHHEPRGLLFGRHTGRVWVPQHARGDVEVGEVEQTFVVSE